MSLLDIIRASAHRSITTTTGDGLLPLRLSKEFVRRANTALGQPLCSAEELEKRRTASARLEQLRHQRAAGKVPEKVSARVQAPVTIYFERDRNVRELHRVEELLASRNIEARRLDVAGDENTFNFVMRTAHVKADELPVVFVADEPIGGYAALVDADVSGKLARSVFPNA